MSSLLSSITEFFRSLTWKKLARNFGIPRFHRFEVVIMRILFAYVLFQCMPLGAPYSSVGTNLVNQTMPGALEYIGEHESELILGPPLRRAYHLIPNAEAKIPYDVQKQPDGIAHVVDLTFFNDDRFVKTLPWIVFPCLILYCAGFGLPVVMPILTFILLGSRTLYNSQGYIHHGFQMVSLVLLAQTVVVLVYAFRNPKEAFGLKRATSWFRDRNFWDVMIRYSQLMIIASYMIPGVIKQFKTGGEWFFRSHYIGVQVVKTHRQNYYNDLDPTKGEKEEIPTMANFMLERRNLTRLLLGAGITLQVIAFLALYNRATLAIFGLLFISFHYLNDIMFGLYFYHVEKLDLIFLVNLPFWIWWLATRKKRRLEEVAGSDESSESGTDLEDGDESPEGDAVPA